MLETIHILLLVTPIAKAQVRKFLEEITGYPAIPGLLWSKNVDSGELHWTVGFYDRRVVEGADFRGVLIKAEDLEFVSPQRHLAADLDGMQLDWRGDKFVIVSPLKH